MNISRVQTRCPIVAPRLFGHSIWVDGLERRSLNSGAFKRSILEEGVSGATSNPTALAKAILDIQTAADLLQPVYARTKRRDGYVSWEVSPHLARDTKGTLEEA